VEYFSDCDSRADFVDVHCVVVHGDRGSPGGLML